MFSWRLIIFTRGTNIQVDILCVNIPFIHSSWQCIHWLTVLLSRVSQINHPILQLLSNCLFTGKWGLLCKMRTNEDHFSSLVLMRTKSSIEDLCASSGYYINGRYFIQISQNGDMIYCRTWKCITLPLNEEMWKYPPIFCLTCLS